MSHLINATPANIERPAVVAVVSGKGGVGKTHISVNLSLALARGNKRVMLLDADMGCANAGLLLGLKPDGGAERVVAGTASIAEAAQTGAAHPLCVGPVEQLPFLKKQDRLTFARCGIVDPQSLEDYIAHDGYKGLARALEIGPKAIIEAVTGSGLRGRGGAGFPTGIKWDTVSKAEAPQKYIVCNADEGDSGTFADRMIMEGDPFVLIEGMTIAGIAVGATQGYIYVRSEYPHAIRALEAAIAAARRLRGPSTSCISARRQGSNRRSPRSCLPRKSAPSPWARPGRAAQ